MERVVYLFGAGFSAPLGVPTVANFLSTARKIARSTTLDGVKDCLVRALEQIDDSSKHLGRYFDYDFRNVEEMLSIIEMTQYLRGRSPDSANFRQFIKHVIQLSTPELCLLPPNSPLLGERGISNWYDHIFGSDRDRQRYGAFVASLFNCGFLYEERPPRISFLHSQGETHYSVITLNYDAVMEGIVKGINGLPASSTRVPLSFNTKGHPTTEAMCLDYAKIHGTVAEGENDDIQVVLPTWNKTSAPEIRPVWRLASSLLAQATHLRILGYSLPDSDAYIRYLLMSSMSANTSLEKIDIICLDTPDNEVSLRYGRLLQSKSYRFKNANVSAYLDVNFEKTREGMSGNSRHLTFSQLERAHALFMATN